MPQGKKKMADSPTTTPATPATTPPAGTPAPKVEASETWMNGQGFSDAQMKAVNDGTSGMHGAMESLKSDRVSLRTELDGIKNAKNIEADEKVTQMQAAIDVATNKANFLESLPNSVTNKTLAYVAVLADDTLLNKDGSANLEKLKEVHPQLFANGMSTDGHAGDGAGGKLPGSKMTGGEAVDYLIRHGDR